MFYKRHRKKIIVIVIALAMAVLVIFSYYLWCVGGAFGYIGGKLGGGKKTGAPGRIRSIIFPINRYQVHLHHWFLAAVALIVCLVINFYVVDPQFFYGCMIGLAVQGIICYDDWFHLIEKNIPQNQTQDGNI